MKSNPFSPNIRKARPFRILLTRGGALLANAVWVLFGAIEMMHAAPPDAKVPTDHAAYLRETKGILDIRTIHQSKLGPNAMNLVIVSAGFTEAEKDKFLAHANDMKETFFYYPPWNRYRDWINFHTVFVGDAGPADSKLKVGGYEGQILMCDNGLATEYGNYAADADATLVLHNSNFSTPACGMWGVTTYNIRDTKSSGSTVHELGHGLAGLGDEYIQRGDAFDGTPESLADTVNVTAEPNPRLCKWHYWTVETWPGPIGPLTYRGSMPIGNFEGAGWPKGIYRPEESCMMRGGRDAFCAVCDETMQANIFRYVDLFDIVEPAENDLILWKNESLDLRVAAISPLRSPDKWLTSQIDLYVSGKKVASSDRGTAKFHLEADRIKPGEHQLGAVLNVQHQMVRRDFGFLSDNRAWKLTVIPHAKPSIKIPSHVTSSPQETINVPVAVQHPNPRLFKLRMEHAPANAALEGGRFRWMPGGKTGSWRVDFIVSFNDRDVLTKSMEIHVDQAGAAPTNTLTIPPMEMVTATTDTPVTAKLSATAAKETQVLFDIAKLPDGATLNSQTGELTWTPTRAQGGSHLLEFRARSGKSTAKGSLLIRVNRPGRPTPVSYSNSYTPDTLARLKQWQESPRTYERIFQTLRLLRDRYARIYEPALVEAEKLFTELPPAYRTNVIDDLSMHAWAFYDKPTVQAWMRRIAAETNTPEAKTLIKTLDLMGSLEKIKKIEITGTREELGSTASSLVKATDPMIRKALETAVKEICRRVADHETCRREILTVLSKTRGPGRAGLVLLVPVERSPDLINAMTTLSRDDDPKVASAAKQVLGYFDGLGTTGNFITRWQVAGPFPAREGISLFDDPFDPEQQGKRVDWKPLTLKPSTDGTYAADLTQLFAGDQRVAYMKTTLHSATDREVLFTAGSDDGIKVWLNGELIHAKNIQRGIKAGEDRFRGQLKSGENTLLCKIVQYTQGWGACMNVYAPDGSPALGVTVSDKP